MTRERIRYLLDAYLQRRCSARELQELSRLLTDPASKSRLHEELETVWGNFNSQETMPEASAEKMLAAIIARQEVAKPSPPRISARWYRWAAAAAVLALVSSLTYYYFSSAPAAATPKRVVASVTQITSDVKPGSNEARLTLADGSSILLDTVTGSTITTQGGTQVEKTDGRVIYRPAALHDASIIYNTLTTERGHQYPLTLSDGTKVLLNASSSIRFPVAFQSNDRSVEITGEVYFEVAKNARPFSVRAAGTTVEVLGTHFNINAYPDEERLNATLVEGKVKVRSGSQAMILAPGQQAQVLSGGEMRLNHKVDTEEVISWTQGYFHFNDASLQTVLRQLSRWYDVDIVYEQMPRDETFGGDIQKSLSLSQVLKILDKSQVKFRIDGKRLIVVK